MKNITMNTKPDKIFKLFQDVMTDDTKLKEINLKVSWGYIYYSGGILSKLQDGVHYIALKGKWRKIE